MKYKIRIEKSRGSYVATCEELPSLIVFGATLEDAKEKANNALSILLEEKDSLSMKEREEIRKKIDRLEKVISRLEDEAKKGLSADIYIEEKERNERELEELKKKLLSK